MWTEPGDYTLVDILIAHGTKCYLCNQPIDYAAPRSPGKPGWENGLHIDHVIPLSKGGSDHLENVKPSHGRCNIIKGNRTWPRKPPKYPPIPKRKTQIS